LQGGDLNKISRRVDAALESGLVVFLPEPIPELTYIAQMTVITSPSRLSGFVVFSATTTETAENTTSELKRPIPKPDRGDGYDDMGNLNAEPGQDAEISGPHVGHRKHDAVRDREDYRA
jgi:hypothetical protein